jgi:hypothetical protein
MHQHVIVNHRDLDSVVVQGLDRGSTSLASATKSPVIATFPLPVGWKLITHRWRQGDALHLNRV